MLVPAPANVACEVRERSSRQGCSSACAGDDGDDGCVCERARPHARPGARVPARGHAEVVVVVVVVAEAG